MRLAIFEKGAIAIKEDNQEWLFGAPEGIKEDLEKVGIEPQVVFTTSFRSPGIGYLGKCLRFKETPLTMNGMSAKPVFKKHGTDYVINSGHGKILFSERGDVSAEDTEGYHLAIIKNKHRSDKFSDHVITWPWPEAEFIINDNIVTPLEISTKVWSEMKDVPDNLKEIDGTPLTVAQANFIARVAKGAGEGEENWAVAISQFKKSYHKEDGKWVENTSEKETVNSFLQDLRNAFNEQFPIKNEGDVVPSYNYYVIDADLDNKVAYVDYKGTNKAISYTVNDGKIIFEPKSNWKDAVTQWVAKEHLTKEQAQYKDNAGKDAGIRVCANCCYYKKPEACCKVEGIINPVGVCMIWELPKNMPESEMMNAYMEIQNGQPQPIFIDVITSYLHKAYNDVSDHLFKLGYLDQDERLKVAGTIGEGLSAFRKAIEKENFANRPIDKMDVQLKEQIDSLLTLKELVPSMPDKIEDEWHTVYKDEEGKDRWASISSVAIKDRQGETFTTKAMDWAVAFGKFIKYKGPLRFRHVPGLDGGDCDRQVRVGDYLFESGTFRDTPLGLKLKELMKDPTYKISLGLAFAKEDIDQEGQYQRAFIFERSMTPKPAVPVTSVIYSVKGKEEMNMLNEKQLEEVAKELGIELSEVQEMYKRATASGLIGLKEFQEYALKEGGGSVATNDDDDEEYTEEKMKEILEGLTVAEMTSLKQMIREVEKQEDEEEMEEEDEEEEMPMKPKKKTKEEGRLEALEESFKEQQKLMVEQTKAIQGLVTAMLSGQQNNGGLAKEAANFIKGLPREQAGGFASMAGKEAPQVDDNEIMQKLKSIEEQLKNQAPAGPSSIYDRFTSESLNRGK